MSEQTDNPLEALAVADTTSPEAETSTAPEGQGSTVASTTDAPSAVQPEGQGLPDAETGLYDLSTVPEEYRSDVERIAKDIDRNANAKFQEHAAFRSTWEPYEATGITDFGPEGVDALVQFASGLVNPETGEVDPDAARATIVDFAQALGVDLAGTSGESEEPDPVTSLRSEFEQWKQSQAQAQEQQQLAELRTQADAGYRKEFAEVETLNGKQFGVQPGPNGEPSERQQLINLAVRFQADHDEPIKAAYQWMQQIRGQAEAALVNGQPTPPAPAEPGGRASSSVQPVDSFEEAERLHKERNSVHA